jgi:phage host-nuclease inhibitor protein Gam
VEIQAILKDASTRIAKFKDVLDAKQSSANEAAKIDKLQKKHDLEKQQAMLELATMKKKMNDKETSMANEYEAKFAEVKAQVETMNKQFQEKIQKFESTNKVLADAE